MTTFDKATLDQLLAGIDPSNPQSMFTDAGLFGQLKKALAERMLQGELSHYLEQQRNGGPAVMIDRQRCPQLIRALDGGYRYGKTRAGQRKPVPDKNLHSHIADAFQYACLSAHTGLNTRIQGRMQRVPVPQRRMPVGAWT